MIHSKVVVLDPFGPNPVVMTGSHNLGPRASVKNDDNLNLISGAPELAAAYATHIIAVYNAYRWRYVRSHAAKEAGQEWAGPEDTADLAGQLLQRQRRCRQAGRDLASLAGRAAAPIRVATRESRPL